MQPSKNAKWLQRDRADRAVNEYFAMSHLKTMQPIPSTKKHVIASRTNMRKLALIYA